MRFALRKQPKADENTASHGDPPTALEQLSTADTQTAGSGSVPGSSNLSQQTDPESLVETNANQQERRRDIDTTEKPNGAHPHGLHGEELEGFPILNYGLQHRKRRSKIAFYFTLLLIESLLLPEALFYGLTFGLPSFEIQDTFAIITALCGTFSPIKFFLGMFKLWRPKTTDRCRPLGQSNRWAFDFTHITITIGYWIFIIILIIGTAPHDQITPLIAMAAPGFTFWTGCVLLFLQLLHHTGTRAPFRISSTAKGSLVPAAVYPFIEDICAVEGHGNREYRERLKARYEASPVFRRMLDQVSWFWIVGAFLAVAISAAIVGSTPWYIGYGFGWGVPFLWGYIWAAITTIFVSRTLKKEKATWASITRP